MNLETKYTNSMKNTKQVIETKKAYYEKQLNGCINTWIKDNKRTSRDNVIRLTERINAYKEVLKLMNEN